ALQLETDFSRFKIYAPWVKHLEFRGGRRLSQGQLDSLYRYSATHILLPNLQSITFANGGGFAQISWMMPFLSPSLTTIEIGSLNHESAPSISLSAFAILLGALSKTCPNLHTLAVRTSTVSAFCASDITRILGYATGDHKLELEDSVKNGPTRALASVCPLVSFTTSSNSLDRASLDLIGAWPLLERLEIEVDWEVDPLFSGLAESAFPSLNHLAFYFLSTEKALGIFRDAPRALMGKLHSIKLISSSGPEGFPFGLRILSVLAKRSPHLQNLWIRLCDLDYLVYSTPISALGVLQKLPLRSLYIEGISLIECDNIPNHLATTFPSLKDIGFPNHRTVLADLQMYCNNLPQLESLCLSLGAESLLSDLGVTLDNIERYRQSRFRTFDVRFHGKSRNEKIPKLSSYGYHEMALFVRYLFSLWPNLQLFEERIPSRDSNSDIQLCTTELINKHLAALSYCNRDPTVNYEDISVLNEESWRKCLRGIPPRFTRNG
ncbi:hypothetical protein FRC08_000317, partial [Ceratobasidium sp. 394]